MSTTTQTHLKVVETIFLMPSKRKRRPKLSLSPQKAEIKPELSAIGERIDGGDLVFSDGLVSWDEKTWKFFDRPHMKAIFDYLNPRFSSSDYFVSPPFFIISMEPGEAIPDPKERPFHIADLLCLWRAADEPRLFPWPALGGFGCGKSLTLPDDIAGSIQLRKVPPQSTMEFLVGTYFPTALAISFFLDTIIVELEQTDERPHEDNLPAGFANSPGIGLRFNWGPLAYTQLDGRKIRPNPRDVDGATDETHYLGFEGQSFTPGMRIFNSLKDLPDSIEWTSGILVEKDGKKKVTVPAQAFDSVLNKNNDQIDCCPHLTIYQGNEKDHTKVAHLDQLIKYNGVRADIGLASLSLGVEFANTTFHDGINIRKLIRLRDCRIGDVFLIDSYMTGPQKMQLDGARFPKALRPTARAAAQHDIQPKGLDSKLLRSPKLPYLELGQGIYSTTVTEIPTRPQIRAGVCGSALIRIVTADGTDVSAEGAVAGFMHFADLQLKSNGEGELMCYADACDSLIDEGWSVVNASDAH